MSGLITSWDSLETVGKKGRAFKRPKDYLTQISRPALKYASIAGFALSIISLAMVII